MPLPTKGTPKTDDQAERRAVLQILNELIGELGEVLDDPAPVAAPFVVGWRMGIEQTIHIAGRRMREVRTMDWNPEAVTVITTTIPREGYRMNLSSRTKSLSPAK
jgi:hypothetical protein